MRKNVSSYNGEEFIYSISTTSLLKPKQGGTEEGFAVEKEEGLTLDKHHLHWMFITV